MRIDPTAIPAYVATATADDDKRLQDAVAALVMTYSEFLNNEDLTVDERESALAKLTAQAKTMERSLIAGHSVDESIAEAFGTAVSSTTGGLAMANQDVIDDLVDVVKAKIGGATTPVATSMAIVIKDILEGRTELAGDQVKAVADLTNAVNAQAAAEAERDTARTEKATAVTQRDALSAAVQEVKDKWATVIGRGPNVRKLNLDELTPATKAALGL